MTTSTKTRGLFAKLRGKRSADEIRPTPAPQNKVHIVTDPEKAQRLEHIERLTHLLDESFTVPGTNFRVGWDSLIGLIPGVGDVATTALSAYLVYQARQAGASNWVITRMLGNLGLDFVVGAIPILGDTFDAFFKANRRNTRLLKKHLQSSQKPTDSA